MIKEYKKFDNYVTKFQYILREKNKQLMQDIVQDAFIKLLKYKTVNKSLINTTIKHTYINHVNKTKRHDISKDYKPRSFSTQPNNDFEELEYEFLLRLSKGEKEIYSLSKKGFKDIEIAEVLNLSHSTIRVTKRNIKIKYKCFSQVM